MVRPPEPRETSMRAYLSASVTLLTAIIAGASGCSPSSDSELQAEASESAASAPTPADVALAKQAVALIAGDDAHCNSCHTASAQDIRRWGAAMRSVESSCLAPTLSLSNAERVACLSDVPSSPTSTFSARKLGLYTADVTHASIHGLFDTGAAGAARYAALKDAAAMPKSGTALTEAQFATVKKWTLAGMPALDEVLANPDLGPCTASLTPALATHLATMKHDGWGARLADASTPMFGCSVGGDPQTCLGNLPDVTAMVGNPDAHQKVRKLRDMPGKTEFWVRSSADGRYSGVGGSKIFDHAAGPTAKGIPVQAPYDPTFFPNNDGFGFAGTDGGIRVCRQSVIAKAQLLPTPKITLHETGCSAIADDVYESVGAATDGAVYWMSHGEHVNDFGDLGKPPSGFDATAVTTLTPMISDGVKYVAKTPVDVKLPYEGDQVLSPSSRLLVTRFGGEPGKRGFRVRKVTWTSASAGTFNVQTEAVGTVCLNGTKPIVSFDERFVVTHQYVDTSESPGLPAGTSNIFMMDLATGDVVQLTKMKAKQSALFPHFRADGWIYFLVKDATTNVETLYATDAAVRRAAAP